MTTKKQTGRPSGAKTKNRVVTKQTILRATCPRCKSSAHKNRRRIRGGITSGTVDGQAYGSYAHFNAECCDCGQALLVAEYELLDPSPA